MKERRAWSSKELMASSIDPYEYNYCETVGEFPAMLDAKVWGNKSNILAYFTFEDGRKIVAAVWRYNSMKREYLGLDEIPLGTKMFLTFRKGRGQRAYLRDFRIARQ